MYKKLFVLALVLSLAFAHGDPMSPLKCDHGHREKPEPLLLDIEEDFNLEGNDHTGRTLASYSNMRMTPNYDRMSSAPSSYQSYVKNKLIPPVLSYLSAALKVKYPVSGTLKLATSVKQVCGGATPKALFTGVATDYYYILDDEYDSSSSAFVASSSSCYLASGSKRPLIAITTLNRAQLVATTDPLLHERNIICTIHEVVHTLGFMANLYPYFLNSAGKVLTGHIKSATLDGSTVTLLDLSPLTSRIQTFFGCTTIKGAYLEKNGGSGTSGVHFEKRQFPFEAMSSGLIYQMAVSQFTLAFLEGTGWFVPDYTYADPYWFGQGKGCNFLTKSCTSSTFSFPEFCKSDARACTVQGRGGGVCTSDALSNKCEFLHPYIGYDCENPDSKDYARLPSIQTFGRGKGSKCFAGTLNSGSSAGSQSTFCFKPTCSGSGTSTKVTIKVGSSSVVCSKKGNVSVSGYKGTIACPDPQEFCKTVGKVACPRNCYGRGTCNTSTGVCTCKSGFTGTDCSGI